MVKKTKKPKKKNILKPQVNMLITKNKKCKGTYCSTKKTEIIRGQGKSGYKRPRLRHRRGQSASTMVINTQQLDNASVTKNNSAFSKIMTQMKKNKRKITNKKKLEQITLSIQRLLR